MSDLHFFHPASVEEAHRPARREPDARRLAHPAPDPHRRQPLRDYFALRAPTARVGLGRPARRRPDTARRRRRLRHRTRGRSSCSTSSALPDDPDVARALVARATAEAVALPGDEEAVHLRADRHVRRRRRRSRPLAGPLREAGWRLLVERRHYEFEPPPGLAADVIDRAVLRAAERAATTRGWRPATARSCATPSTPTTAS